VGVHIISAEWSCTEYFCDFITQSIILKRDYIRTVAWSLGRCVPNYRYVALTVFELLVYGSLDPIAMTLPVSPVSPFRKILRSRVGTGNILAKFEVRTIALIAAILGLVQPEVAPFDPLTPKPVVPNMKWIEWPIAEIWPFEIFQSSLETCKWKSINDRAYVYSTSDQTAQKIFTSLVRWWQSFVSVHNDDDDDKEDDDDDQDTDDSNDDDDDDDAVESDWWKLTADHTQLTLVTPRSCVVSCNVSNQHGSLLSTARLAIMPPGQQSAASSFPLSSYLLTHLHTDVVFSRL